MATDAIEAVEIGLAPLNGGGIACDRTCGPRHRRDISGDEIADGRVDQRIRGAAELLDDLTVLGAAGQAVKRGALAFLTGDRIGRLARRLDRRKRETGGDDERQSHPIPPRAKWVSARERRRTRAR